MARYCYHADESFAERRGSKIVYFVVRIEEGQPGYWKMRDLHYDTVPEAKALASSLNAELGLCTDDVFKIRASSLAASPDKN